MAYGLQQQQLFGKVQNVTIAAETLSQNNGTDTSKNPLRGVHEYKKTIS